MATLNSRTELVTISSLKSALLKANTHQQRTEKLEFRKAAKQEKQNDIKDIKNTDKDDRRNQSVGSKWLKDYIRAKQPMLLRKDELGLHAYFSINLAKHARPDTYNLDIDAQKIIDLCKLRLVHAYEAEVAYRDRLREERIARDREAGELPEGEEDVYMIDP